MNSTSVDIQKYTVYSRKVVETAGLNFAILLGVVGLFATGVKSRVRQISICYDVRRRIEEQLCEDDINQPPPEGMTPLSVFFFPSTLGQGLELLRVAGLDGVVAVRFAMMCFMFSVLSAPAAIGLCYVYHSGPSSQGKEDLQSLQMSNQHGPYVHFAAVVAAWWISCALMLLLHVEYKQFTLLRLLYFTGEHLESTAKATRDYFGRTIMVQGVPPWIKTHADLRAAFTKLFDSGVERAVLCVDASSLRNAMHLHEELHKDRQVIRQMNSGGCLAFTDIAMRYGVMRLLRIWTSTGPDIREAMAETQHNLEKTLEEFESQAGEDDNVCQEEHPILERTRSEQFMMQALRDHINLHNKDPALPNIKMPERLRRTTQYFNEAKQKGLLHGCCGTSLSFAKSPFKGMFRAFRYVLGHKRSEPAGFVTFRNRSSQAIAVQMTLYQSSKSTITSMAPYPNDIIWENLCIPEAQVAVRAFFSLCVMLLALVLWSAVAALIQAVANLTFIHKWLLVYLPSVSRTLRLEDIFQWGEKQFFWTALNGFLPALALTLLLVVLPPLIRGWSRVYEGRKSRSEVMVDSVRVCFIFNLVTMYVTVFSGSFLQSGFLASGNPVEVTIRVLRGVASKLDDVSGYLMCYIFTKLGVRMAVYLCRPYVVVPWLLCNILAALLPQSKVENGTAILLDNAASLDDKTTAQNFLKENPCYDWIITDLSIILALCTMYGIMSPVLILAAVPCFWVYAAMVRYNVAFVYTQEYDSGGRLFFQLIDQCFVSLQLSLLLLQTYLVSMHEENNMGALGAIGAVCWHISLPTLMIFICIVWRNLHRRFQHVCSSLSLQLAKELDAASSISFSQNRLLEGVVYQDPVVMRARQLLGGSYSSHSLWGRRH